MFRRNKLTFGASSTALPRPGRPAALPLLPALVLAALVSLAAPAEAVDVVLDNGSPGTLAEGVWGLGTSASDYGTNFSYRAIDGRYTFRPSLAPGRYGVYLWWVQDVNQHTAVPVSIGTHQGTVSLTVNQSVNGGVWNLLGTYDLDPDNKVVITVNGTKRVCVDAIKYSPVAPANPPPAAPTGLTATPSGDNILVDWKDSTETDIKGYSVFRSVTPGGPYLWNARETTTSSRNDNWVVGGTRYYYIVIASDMSGGLSLPSAEVSATAPVIPSVVMDNGSAGTTKVGTWSSVTGSACYGGAALYTYSSGSFTFAPQLSPGYYRVMLWWNDDYKLSTAVPITIGTSSGTVTKTVNQSMWGGGWIIIDVPSLNATSTVKINVQGTLKTCADAVRFELLNAPNSPPSAPGGLVATAADKKVSLDWNNNPETDIASYSVYRSTTSGSGFALLRAGLITSNYDDLAVVNGTTYYYTVFAVDTAGLVSGSSAQVSAAPVDLPPAAPAGLTATPDVGIIRLDWSDNIETDLASYSVYRSTTSGTGYVLLAAGLTASRYDDRAVTAGTTYFYIVKAVDLGGKPSAASAQVSGKPLVASMTWDAPALNQDGTPLLDLAGYKVYRGTQSGVYGTVVSVGMTTSYGLNLSPGTYYFRVTAYDTLGNESVLSNEATFTQP